MSARASCRIVAAVFALGAISPTWARAGSWLAPVPLNLSNGSTPGVGLDAGGNAVALWQTNPLDSDIPQIQGARHRAGTPGFTALPNYSNDAAMGHTNHNPVVAMNASGNGIVAWISGDPTTEQIALRTIRSDGSVGPVLLTQSRGLVTGEPATAINSAGDVVVAWERGSNIDAITRSGLSGSFTNLAMPDTLTTSSSGSPSVAIDGAGHAVVVWPQGGGVNGMMHAPGGSWSATGYTPLFTTNHTFPAVTVGADSAGQMVVAFTDNDGTNEVVSAVTGTVAGGWGASPAVLTLSNPGVVYGPGVNVADNGAAVVVWSTSSNVQSSRRAPGGSFAGPGSVQSLPAGPDNLAFAGDARGDAVMTWSQFDTAVMQNVVRAAVEPAGASSFGASQIVSSLQTFASFPSAALDNSGDAIVSFDLGATGEAGVAYAVFDGAGPKLGAPAGSTMVAPGMTDSFSVAQPVDAFSAVTGVRWTFGDGSAAATGTSVRHAFARAGRYTVTVTATDAAGNSSKATLTITVTAQCIVPKLAGKTLAQATKALRAVNCRLGKVHKHKAPKHATLVVISSSPGAGARRPAGTKVDLTLGRAPKRHP